MSEDRSEMNSEVGLAKSEDGFPRMLHAVARIGTFVGGVGAVALVLVVGHRNPSHALLIFFAIWVVSPFAGLALAQIAARRWSTLARAMLHSLTLILAVSSLAIYGIVAADPPSKPASLFLVVPFVSWLLIAIVVPITAFASAGKTGAGRLFKAFGIAMILAVLGIGALLGSVWLEHRRELSLPNPSGSFPIGRAIYDWVDDAHFDALAPVPGTKRELLVWIWYPSRTHQSVGWTSEYVPAALLPKGDRAEGALFWRLLTRNPSKVRAHSMSNPDVSEQQRSYPVVIMRAGASAEVWKYSTLAEDLASHGYIVVAFDAPYRTGVVVFPDGRSIRRTPENNPESRPGVEQPSSINNLLAAWTADIAFVLDRLELLNTSDNSGKFIGRLDMTRVGVFGHSFGGAQALQFCHDDSRCKAGIDVDGRPFGSVIREGIRQPFMFLLSSQIHSSDPESQQIKADIQSIYDRLPVNGRLRVAIRGANHFTFSDDGALLKSYIVRCVLRTFGQLGIDGRRQLAVTTYCVRSFFDAYLKGSSLSPLKISSPLYPELEVFE